MEVRVESRISTSTGMVGRHTPEAHGQRVSRLPATPDMSAFGV